MHKKEAVGINLTILQSYNLTVLQLKNRVQYFPILLYNLLIYK